MTSFKCVACQEPIRAWHRSASSGLGPLHRRCKLAWNRGYNTAWTLLTKAYEKRKLPTPADVLLPKAQ